MFSSTFIVLLIAVISRIYLGESDASAVSGVDKSCSVRSSCRFRKTSGDEKIDVESYFDNYNCFCDRKCGTYQDCCDDAIPVKALDKDYECVNVPEIDATQGVRLVVGCPADWKDQWIRRQCENDDDTDEFLRIPAKGVLTGRNYRNRFCSLCHGERAKLWRVEVRCRNTRYLNVSHFALWNHTDKCDVKFMPSKGDYYRQCLLSVDYCPSSYRDLNVTRLCKIRQASYVYNNNIAYKNVDCARCNDAEDGYSCTRPNYRGRLENTLTKRPYPFAILMDMNSGTYESGRWGRYSRPIKPKTFLRCSEGKIHDHFSGKCRRSWCLSHELFVNGECLSKEARVNNSLEIDQMTNDNRTMNESDCVWIKLDSNEKYVISGNRLYLDSHAANYSRSQFYVISGNVFVCVDVDSNGSRKHMDGWRFSEIQSYVTMAGLIISVLALCVHLAVYSILSPLRNVPGKNLMHLSASLLIANLTFLISPQLSFNYSACAAMAVLIHWSFLHSFCWMNVMSFDIWYTFRATSVNTHSNRKSSKCYMSYIIYACGTSILVVLVAIVVDFTDNTCMFKPLYGRESRCWINNSFALAMFFAAPLAILLLCNIIFYVLTVASIVHVDINTKVAAQSKSDRQRCFLYMKLCALMGLTWLFGFLAAFTDVTILWYVFTVFNTLQGLFICVSFVFTRKVMRLLKDKVSGVPYKETSLSNSSTQHTRSTSFKSMPTSSAQKTRDSTEARFSLDNYSEKSLERTADEHI